MIHFIIKISLNHYCCYFFFSKEKIFRLEDFFNVIIISSNNNNDDGNDSDVYKATKRISNDCFKKIRFSLTLQSIVSLQISIWRGKVSGISVNRSINVLTTLNDDRNKRLINYQQTIIFS